jgi:hypothetical protein
MKIRAYILTKGREVLIEEIDDYKDYFSLGSHLYYLDRKAVSLTSKDGKLNPTPEVIYFEGVPIPVGSSENKSLLDDVVADNFLRQFSEGPSIMGWFRKVFVEKIVPTFKSPQSIIMWVVLLIVAWYLINALLSGGLKV